ncbi:hypothetical protein F4861DRAFT_546717 [Xylaria intraflava]|nr:hypothetical protein F4861DRAFT_546717 [Xylaria intraflava]
MANTIRKFSEYISDAVKPHMCPAYSSAVRMIIAIRSGDRLLRQPTSTLVVSQERLDILGPLLSFSFDYTAWGIFVKGILTETSISGQYQYRSGCFYIFKFPPEALAVDFAAQLENVNTNIIVNEKAEADRKYKNAMKQGTQARKLDKVNEEGNSNVHIPAAQVQPKASGNIQNTQVVSRKLTPQNSAHLLKETISGPPIQQVPIPGITFRAVRSFWYAIINGTPNAAAANVTTRYQIPEKVKSEYFHTVSYDTVKPGHVIRTLAARAFIQVCKDKELCFTDPTDKDCNEAEIIRLGKVYELASTQTTYATT